MPAIPRGRRVSRPHVANELRVVRKRCASARASSWWSSLPASSADARARRRRTRPRLPVPTPGPRAAASSPDRRAGSVSRAIGSLRYLRKRQRGPIDSRPATRAHSAISRRAPGRARPAARPCTTRADVTSPRSAPGAPRRWRSRLAIRITSPASPTSSSDTRTSRPTCRPSARAVTRPPRQSSSSPPPPRRPSRC